jgi:hypothetical protein
MLTKLLVAVLGLLLLGVACAKGETRLTDSECGGLASAEILLGAATQGDFDVEIRNRLNEVYNDVQSIGSNHCWGGEARALTEAASPLYGLRKCSARWAALTSKPTYGLPM